MLNILKKMCIFGKDVVKVCTKFSSKHDDAMPVLRNIIIIRKIKIYLQIEYESKKIYILWMYIYIYIS